MEGGQKEVICADITDVRSEFWKMSEANMDECEMIIQRKFNAFLVTIFIASIFTFSLHRMYILSIQYYISQPLSELVEKHINKIISQKLISKNPNNI